MTPSILFLLRSDPSTTHRSIEGLRIALSFLASGQSTDIILLNHTLSLLSKDFNEGSDNDTLEKLLPIFQDMRTPFYVEKESSIHIDFDPSFSIHPVSHSQISDMIARSSYSMAF
tara:strand:- start:494 stop:838 length:345 start_codon:yes stop_codon:yes gene_type:complete